ncbi:MAG: hypothetical protein MI725_12045 [Pirellulales bacterium]|nr:hypothetical protein [Pirellulales bacterium]
MKFIVEQHSDGFIAYPLGLRGVVVGQGDTRDSALADAQSAAKFHLQTFGNEAMTGESQPIDAEVVEVGLEN